MRDPGREFGSERPSVIYLALRWNNSTPSVQQEHKLLDEVAVKLEVRPIELRIYNIARPSKGRGMTLNVDELDDLDETIQHITNFVRRRPYVQRIVVGGKSQPMPVVALLVKLRVPRVRIELRSHHRAREVNMGPLTLVKVIRE